MALNGHFKAFFNAKKTYTLITIKQEIGEQSGSPIQNSSSIAKMQYLKGFLQEGFTKIKKVGKEEL